jgi:Legionella pneumophila major outer membrane protein precursor
MMIRKITVGLATLLSTLTINAFASARAPFDINIPSYNGGFTFGLAGLYLRPSADALDYGVLYSASDLDSSVIKRVKPDQNWGYRVSLGYILPCTANDVTVTYTNFSKTTKNSLDLGKNEVFGPLPLFDNITIQDSNATAKFKYEALDLDLGQHVNLGGNTHLRFSTGVRLANLRHTFSTYYKGNELSTNQVQAAVDITERSEFKGIGPSFGIDAEYNLGYGFGIVGHTSAALLIGHFKDNLYHYITETIPSSTSAEPITEAKRSFSQPGVTHAVPNLTGKLGLNYNYQFNHSSKVVVETGYQVDHFFNAATRCRDSELANFQTNISENFAGPYVGIQLHL